VKPSEHANLLSIFSWILAGIQGFMFLFLALYVVIFGAMTVLTFLNAKQSDPAGIAVIAGILLLVGLLALFGLICIVANIRMGKRLRGGEPPSQRSLIGTAILNMLSFLCGGIMVMPFGIALGVYSLWFALSDPGKAFLSHYPNQPRPLPISDDPYGVTPHGWR
jgi:hypothetical protein